jgi:hypothetical protein
VDAGMACAVTVHGSIGAEMAFMGVPTIAAGDNGYISFNFCRTARSQDEYQRLLKDYRNFRMDKAEMRKEACAFQYMYLFNLDEADLALRDAALTLRSSIHNQITAQQTLSAQDILDGTHALTRQPGFTRFIDTLAACLGAVDQAKATTQAAFIADHEKQPADHAARSEAWHA